MLEIARIVGIKSREIVTLVKIERALRLVEQMDDEGFGSCSSTGACEVECPKGITLVCIVRLNSEHLKAQLKG